MTRARPAARVATAAMVLVLVAPAHAAGQPTVTFTPAPGIEAANGAAQTRGELQRLLAQHPPALRVVLRADPSLVNSADYLEPYPRLAAFLKEHPEIARDPAYFFGGGALLYYGGAADLTPQQRAINMLEDVVAGLAMFIAFLTAVLVLGSLVRQALSHRRWLRQSRVQTDVHTKILDRLQSNDELLAYIQTPAGRRFLESGPSPQGAELLSGASPHTRILWSVQGGVMLGALGLAMWIVQQGLTAEIAVLFRAIGVVTLMLGAGAVVSAGISYLLSVRLGLIGAPKEP